MIRKATDNDIKAVHSLLLEGARRGQVLIRSIEELYGVIDSFFVYERGDKVMGCCSLEIYSQKIAEIRSLVVSSKWNNKGIGSLLIETCLQEAKEKGIRQVLSVTDKVGLFQRMGFNTQIQEKQAMFLQISSIK